MPAQTGRIAPGKGFVAGVYTCCEAPGRDGRARGWYGDRPPCVPVPHPPPGGQGSGHPAVRGRARGRAWSRGGPVGPDRFAPQRRPAPGPAASSALGARRLRNWGEGSPRDNSSLLFLSLYPHLFLGESLQVKAQLSTTRVTRRGLSVPAVLAIGRGGSAQPRPAPGKRPRAGGGRVFRVRARKQPGRKGSGLGTLGKGGCAPAADAGPATPEAGMPPRSPGLVVAPQGSVTQKG